MRTDRLTAVERAYNRRLVAPLTRRDLVKTVTVAAGAVVFAGYGKSTVAKAQGNIRLVQWYHQYGEEGTQDAALRYAEEYTTVNPNVEVEMVWVPGDYEATVLPAALLTDEGPDVFEGHVTQALVDAGQVVPLDDLYTPEVRADFHPNDIATATVDGKIYSVKMVNDTGVLYYRKSLLEEAGVQPPTTMDEVIAAANTLNSGRVKGLFLGNDGGITALLTLAPQSAGTDILVNNEIVFNNERTVLAYEKIRELNDSGALLVGAPTDWWDPSAFTGGLAAMQWTGLWAMPGIREGIGEDFGIVPWPALDAQGVPVTFWGGWAEMVNAKSRNIDAAKAFVRWLWIENTANQQDWNLSYGFHVPPRLSAAAEAEPLKTPPPADAVRYFYENGKILPPQWTPAMGTALTNALSNIVKNGAPAAEEVAAAAQTCEQELQRLLG
ncbi:MAG: ABC transporter, substrate-binding protein (cluster 1, maltose/g3p/polyamine/iron) [uncultured Thermomicrobiales bacterium]|uniref:ABC transporter, substrate-binding protein (Cluster 1, maltose/g3p/polyamine/iron) n=1 Tax=uncultured Thermomicrobiales bacterium TaxID=1645740 RepID=A0A6J4UV00_9BACT|nr:MAG: ABC transporter, substrate-binding protein (cluster 1, maltose/g3p/polyamine/iron) [uncultured Thermomicrobiales bacterium]